MYGGLGGGVDTQKCMLVKIGSYGRLPRLLRCNEAVKRCGAYNCKGTLSMEKLEKDANFLQVW